MNLDFRENIIPHDHAIDLQDRMRIYGYKPKLIWFTGLSGSGKSTLASALEVALFNEGAHTYILDGDNIRSGLNNDLDFSEASRVENIRRISEVGKLFVDSGTVALSAFISPFIRDRQAAREKVGSENFIEVFVECPLEVCESRDVKGLYAKARAGLIKDFTGISSPFEEPQTPEIKVNTADNTLDACLEKLLAYVRPLIFDK